jgi:hypothetical protein
MKLRRHANESKVGVVRAAVVRVLPKTDRGRRTHAWWARRRSRGGTCSCCDRCVSSNALDFQQAVRPRTLKTFDFKQQTRISRDPIANNSVSAALALCALVAGGAAGRAQVRFEAVARKAVTGVPDLKIVTLRDARSTPATRSS